MIAIDGFKWVWLPKRPGKQRGWAQEDSWVLVPIDHPGFD